MLTDRLVPVEVRKAHTEVAGFVFAGVGVIYAVLLAFIAVAVWAQFDKAEGRVLKEANLVGDLYFDAQALPPPVAGRVQEALRDYAEAVIHGEWPQMVEGRTPDNAVLPLHRLFAAIMSYEPDTNRGTVYLAEILKQANELSEARLDPILFI